MKPLVERTDARENNPFPLEHTTVNGRAFSRCVAEKHWPRTNGRFWWADDVGLPKVLCECGHDTFRLKYGEYECVAVCTACGLEDVVYDG